MLKVNLKKYTLKKTYKIFLNNKFFITTVVVILSLGISNTLVLSNNKFDFGFSKLNNTWNFLTKFDISILTSMGSVFLQNSYQGAAVDQINNSFRDSENFKFIYEIQVTNNIFSQTEFNTTIFSDLRTVGINNLQRISGVSGIRLTHNKIGDLKILLGAENNKQVDIISNGFLTKVSGFTEKYELNEYKINSKLESEFLFLNDNRKSKDIDLIISIYRDINKINKNIIRTNDLLNFDLQYKLLGRNFLHILSDTSKNHTVEDYAEQRISGAIQSSFELTKKITANVNAMVENISITRDNNIVLASNNLNNKENTSKYYKELKLDIKSGLDITLNDFFQSCAFQVTYRGEENNIKQLHNLNTDISLLQNFEAQKDNSSATYKLFYKNIIKISALDTLFTDINYSKLEYDTPSKSNNDDRDELYIAGCLEYHHRFSDLLLLTSKLNLIQNHLVFLMSERSGQNNWNKILSLQFGVIFDNELIRYSPHFEVLANYTIYDFDRSDLLKNNIKSYSFRQFSYKDSVLIRLSDKYIILSRSTLRYYEQSRLYWNSFSELPQQGNFEVSLMPVLINNVQFGASSNSNLHDYLNNNLNNNLIRNKNIKFSLGVRLFYLSYGQISSENKFMSPQKIHTISPDISVDLFYNKLTLSCYGWLEYKYINNKYTGVQPNLFLQTSCTL